MKKILTCVTALLAAAPAALALNGPHPNCDRPAVPQASKELIVRGSTTLRPISTRAVSLFRSTHPDITIVQDALGSSAGIRQWIEGYCLQNGIPVSSCDLNGDGELVDEGKAPFADNGDAGLPADICQSSRAIRPAERAKAESVGMCVQEFAVALDGLGIIVHPSNDVPRLNQSDIKFIFENDMNTACAGPCTWAALGLGTSTERVVPVSRTPEGGTFGSFVDLYGVSQCRLAGARLNQNIPNTCTLPQSTSDNPSVMFVGSNDEITAAVATIAGAVGYIGISFQNPAVRNVPVARSAGDAAVAASFQTVQEGTFAFRRNLFVYTNGVPPAGDPRAEWIEFLSSRLGQAVVADVGFVPVVPHSNQGGTTQLLLEDRFTSIAQADAGNIVDRLARIAAAAAFLQSNPGNGPAQTDFIESQFGVEEYFVGDNRIVRNLLDRVADRIADGECSSDSSAGRHLASAETAWTAAQDAVSACSPVFPVTCGPASFDAWLSSLSRAYRDGALAEKACSDYDPRHARGLGYRQHQP